MKTYFAKPDRTLQDELCYEIDSVKNSPVISGILESVGGLLAILNSNRQIVALNDRFLQTLGVDEPGEILGLRPGEAVGCIHAYREPAGCGTSKYCSSCGAAISIVSAQSMNGPVERVCTISTSIDGKETDLVFSIRAFPMHSCGKQYILMFLQDISGKQQKAALERTFFHDVNNMLQVLVGASEMLVEKENSTLSRTIYQAIMRLQNEISIQHFLSQKDEFTYDPHWSELSTRELIADLELFFERHPLNRPPKVNFSRCPDSPVSFTTDQSLLWRILHNMILNALEATDNGDEVFVWFDRNETEITFKVWNRQVIDERVALRIFERNYSTKGFEGRGIGTYSMKFFGEKVLGGKVAFTSNDTDGTTFTFTTPLN